MRGQSPTVFAFNYVQYKKEKAGKTLLTWLDRHKAPDQIRPEEA